MSDGHGLLTRSQKQAQAAFKCAQDRARQSESRDEYKTFAMRFPALVHSCGLAQAVAFAQQKNEAYLGDLKNILQKNDLGENCRKASLSEYLHLTREVMQSAAWLKRYVEAEFPKKNNSKGEM